MCNSCTWADGGTLDSSSEHGRHGLAAQGTQHCELLAGANLCCQPPTLQRLKQLQWGHSWHFLQRRPAGKRRRSDHHWRLLQHLPPALAVLSAAGGVPAPCLQAEAAGIREPCRCQSGSQGGCTSFSSWEAMHVQAYAQQGGVRYNDGGSAEAWNRQD